MFNALGAYIKNIALLMLMAIFIEMLVPNGKIKKYVSVIVGAIVIFTMVGKITDILASAREITVPAFQNEQQEITKATDIKERLTDILYREMKEESSIDSQGLDIHVDRVTLYN
ncbi:hypothetical protein IMSAG049_00889 [Clostridiales bacterium]|nr:hypothetical protein IMSAG049_00889 [Clostridiales bacterium]